MRLTKLEQRALDRIAGSRADGHIIAHQLAAARVDQRERTATGFRTFLWVDPVGRHLDKSLWKTEDMPVVYASHPALKTPARFTLVLADGFVSCLVAETQGEPWPRDPALFLFEN